MTGDVYLCDQMEEDRFGGGGEWEKDKEWPPKPGPPLQKEDERKEREDWEKDKKPTGNSGGIDPIIEKKTRPLLSAL